MKKNNLLDKKNDSVDNIRLNNFTNRDLFTNKSESPESFRHNNIYFTNFNLINNNFNHSNSIIYNNNFDLSNLNDNNINLNNNVHIHPNNMNNLNIINNNYFNNLHNFNNTNKINDINIHFNNSPHNSNSNLNLSYNNSPHVNNSFEDLNLLSKKRGDSFNSCPSLKGNHLSFKSTDDSCNNKINNSTHNNVIANFNNNFPMNPKPLNNNINNPQYQNYLSMQNLFLNLNPYTASLMRNNNPVNKLQYNSSKSHNLNQNNINNSNAFNNKPMSLFNKNINTPSKKLHYNHSYHNINNFNNSFNGKINNDNLNLNTSNIGSSHSIKKKRTSLFQNESNKEKDLRDFKRFCDGLKMPMNEYICNQIGSRIMQKYLKKFPSHIRTLLITKVSPYIDKLICDTYGNYFCQKLYKVSELHQRISILNILKNNFITISKNKCGAHAIQSIIGEIQNIKEKNIILEYIQSHELELAYDAEGTHVLQKILSVFEEDVRTDLNKVLCDKINLNSLCQDAKGICVIKKLISGTKDENNKRKIIEDIYDNCIEIALSPFGNYIIQLIFEEWDINICSKLIENCLDNAFILSSQKYSSNIIVKILDLYCDEKKDEFNKYKFFEKLKNIFFDEKNLSDLYNNKYGRLLLNKICKLISPEEKINLKNKFKDQKSLNEALNELFS